MVIQYEAQIFIFTYFSLSLFSGKNLIKEAALVIRSAVLGVFFWYSRLNWECEVPRFFAPPNRKAILFRTIHKLFHLQRHVREDNFCGISSIAFVVLLQYFFSSKLYYSKAWSYFFFSILLHHFLEVCDIFYCYFAPILIFFFACKAFWG